MGRKERRKESIKEGRRNEGRATERAVGRVTIDYKASALESLHLPLLIY